MKRQDPAITFHPSVPSFVKRRSNWCKKLILPDWLIYIDLSDQPGGSPHNEGLATYNHRYHHATLTFRRDIKDSPVGHQTVIHEFLHPLFSHLRNSASLLCTDEASPLYENYCGSEENIITHLERIIYALAPEI